jgi:hypothetical protein
MLCNFVSFTYPTHELPTTTHSNIFIKKFKNIGGGEMLSTPNEFYFMHLLANKAQPYTKPLGFVTLFDSLYRLN